jgi:hypothetical protein
MKIHIEYRSNPMPSAISTQPALFQGAGTHRSIGA